MKLFSVIAILFFSLASTFAFAQNISPGLWESDTSFKLNGLPMPSSIQENCVKANEAKNPKNTIEKALKKNKCQLTKWKLTNNQVNASVDCNNEDYKAKGQISGTFEKKSYNLVGSISGNHKIFGDATADVELKGKWLKDCK